MLLFVISSLVFLDFISYTSTQPNAHKEENITYQLYF